MNIDDKCIDRNVSIGKALPTKLLQKLITERFAKGETS